MVDIQMFVRFHDGTQWVTLYSHEDLRVAEERLAAYRKVLPELEFRLVP